MVEFKVDLGEGQEFGGKTLGGIPDGWWRLARERYGGWMGTAVQPPDCTLSGD